MRKNRSCRGPLAYLQQGDAGPRSHPQANLGATTSKRLTPMLPGRISPFAFWEHWWLSCNIGVTMSVPPVLADTQARDRGVIFDYFQSHPHPTAWPIQQALVENLSRNHPLFPAPMPPSGPAPIISNLGYSSHPTLILRLLPSPPRSVLPAVTKGCL